MLSLYCVRRAGSVGYGGATDSVGMLAERNAEAPGRLVNEVEIATGKDIDSSRNEIKARKTERARVANEDYRPVDSITFSTDEALELLESPLAKPYIKKAIEAYASDPNSGFNLEQLQKLMAGDPDIDLLAQFLQGYWQMRDHLFLTALIRWQKEVRLMSLEFLKTLRSV